MKFTWGTGILIAIITFVTAGIIFLIFAFSFDVNLVQEEYYKKGIDYQTEIDAIKRAREYKDSIKIIQESDKIFIVFPENIDNVDSGLVHFFRPSDRFQDLRINILNNNINIVVEKSKLHTGRYNVDITWYNDGLKYYIEKLIIIK